MQNYFEVIFHSFAPRFVWIIVGYLHLFLKISRFAAQRSSISSINLMALLVKEIFSFSWCLSLVLMNYGAVWADTATNWPEINEICGISYADRIVGGTRASIGQFPWIAHVGIVREYSESSHGNSAWVMSRKNESVQDLFSRRSLHQHVKGCVMRKVSYTRHGYLSWRKNKGKMSVRNLENILGFAVVDTLPQALISVYLQIHRFHG